jgi:hypothetical protein
MSVEAYDRMSPFANKLLNPNGAVVMLNGTEVLPADGDRSDCYDRMSPFANKMLNPDGSISQISSGGGGGSALTEAVTDVEIPASTADGSTITVTYTDASGATTTATLSLPMASTTVAGVMPPTAMAMIDQLMGMVELLQQGIFPRGMVTNTTAEIIADPTILTTYIQDNYSRTPEQGDMLVDSDSMQWVFSGDEWIKFGSNTIPTFTNDIPGLVQGKDEDGYGYADGKFLSVTGWSDLKSSVATAQSTADGKLDKVTTSGSQRLYSITTAGAQATQAFGTAAQAYSVIARDGSGRAQIVAPDAASPATTIATKGYVDSPVTGGIKSSDSSITNEVSVSSVDVSAMAAGTVYMLPLGTVPTGLTATQGGDPAEGAE